MAEESSLLARYWNERLQRLRTRLAQAHVDALLVADPKILAWLGHYGASQALVSLEQVITGTTQKIVKHLEQFTTIGIDDRMPACHLLHLQRVAPQVTWQAQTRLIEQLLVRKDEAELAVMREAARITRQMLAQIENQIRPGVSELELLSTLYAEMLSHAGTTWAFDPSIGSGEQRSRLPWAGVTNRILQPGDEVLIDIGVALWGYCTDMARSYRVAGGESRGLEEWKKARNALVQVFTQVCSAVRPGIRGAELHQIGEQALALAGFDGKLPHALGHGVGLRVHEAPLLAPGHLETLEAGMVLAIEPSILLPSGGGLRYEELVLVTEQGGEVLL